MTVDIRTAAQREAGKLFPPRVMHFHGGAETDLADPWRKAFEAGAVWAATRVTPTREQLATIVDAHADTYDGIQVYEVADATLALMQELAEGNP